MWPRQGGCSSWDEPLGCCESGLESEEETSLFYQHPKNSEGRASMQRCWEGWSSWDVAALVGMRWVW